MKYIRLTLHRLSSESCPYLVLSGFAVRGEGSDVSLDSMREFLALRNITPELPQRYVAIRLPSEDLLVRDWLTAVVRNRGEAITPMAVRQSYTCYLLLGQLADHVYSVNGCFRRLKDMAEYKTDNDIVVRLILKGVTPTFFIARDEHNNLWRI